MVKKWSFTAVNGQRHCFWKQGKIRNVIIDFMGLLDYLGVQRELLCSVNLSSLQKLAYLWTWNLRNFNEFYKVYWQQKLNSCLRHNGCTSLAQIKGFSLIFVHEMYFWKDIWKLCYFTNHIHFILLFGLKVTQLILRAFDFKFFVWLDINLNFFDWLLRRDKINDFQMISLS